MDNKKNLEIINIQNKLRKKLSEYRFYHSIGVQYTAAALAMRYGQDIYLASLAGVLHDCAKYMSDEDIISKCVKHNIDIDEDEKLHPQLLHGKLGAYYARKKYRVESEEVLKAIKYHTTGTPNMTTLQKIIYISDYIEPNRKDIAGLEEIRMVAFVDLDRAVIQKLTNTSNYLKIKDVSMQGIALETYNYYIK